MTDNDKKIMKAERKRYKEYMALRDQVTKHIDAKEHAKILRRELKLEFPDIKFSVRSEYFAGGSSVKVYTKDHEGFRHPRHDEISEFVNKFDGFRSDLSDNVFNVGFEYGGERIIGAKFCSYNGKKY